MGKRALRFLALKKEGYAIAKEKGKWGISKKHEKSSSNTRKRPREGGIQKKGVSKSKETDALRHEARKSARLTFTGGGHNPIHHVEQKSHSWGGEGDGKLSLA